MQIHLNEIEIQEALLDHINSTGVPLGNSITTVTLIAGRGVNGHSAIIDIERKEKPEKSSDNPEEESNDKQQAIKFDFGVLEED